MGLRIQTNTAAIAAQRSLGAATRDLQGSLAKLSSGYRVNKAADDAAGLAISEKMKADIRGLNMAKGNANDGISLVQTAEGALNEIGNILSRLRELSVQGASDTIGNSEREYIDREYIALKDEIDRITYSTEYNGTLLLVGDPKNVPEILTKRLNDFPLEVQVGKNWYEAVDGFGAEERFQRNPVNIIRLDLGRFDSTTTGLNIGTGDEPGSAGTFSLEGTPTDSKHRAQKSIASVDNAISKIAGFRADLGAIQNRLGSTIDNLSVQVENYSTANGRIRDTDYGVETSNLTKSSIVQQAATAVLAQANQFPSVALKLLN